MQVPMVLHLAIDPSWVMHSDNPAISKPNWTVWDAELTAGCKQTALPRIIGTVNVTVDGIQMDLVNRSIFFQ